MAQVQVVELLSEVTQLCRECPTVTLVQAYISAARQFCNKSRWLVRRVDMATAVDVPVYLVPGFEFEEVIGINAMSLAENPTTVDALTEGFSGGWNPNAPNTGGEVPSEYQYIPEGRFALYRTPAQVYPIALSAVLQPKAAAVSIDASLLPSWDFCLQAGALAYLLNLPRTPWTDKPEARVQMIIFNGLVNQAASSAMRGYNAGAATTDRSGSTSGGLRTRILPI